jgi:hypothetical protein
MGADFSKFEGVLRFTLQILLHKILFQHHIFFLII